MIHRTLIVDGPNMVYRSIHAARKMDLSVHGVNTGPLTLFIGLITRYVREVKPDRMVVCWDGGRSIFRTALDPDYKGARVEHDVQEHEDPMRPFGMAKEFLSLANIHHVEHHGVEADDIIAAYIRHDAILRGRPGEVPQEYLILSGDKDMGQLITDHVTQIRFGDDRPWDIARVEEHYGCPPWHLPVVMSLTGDDIDGVAGVKGVATKTAVKLLKPVDFDLDALLQNPPRAVQGYEERIRLNLRLVSLLEPLEGLSVGPVPLFEPTVPGSFMAEEFEAFLARFEMKSVLSKWREGTLWTNPRAPQILSKYAGSGS